MFGMKGNGKQLNGIISAEHPLPHRPGVVVVKTKSGMHVLGDGDPFSQAELIAVGGGLVEPSGPRIEFTAEETQALQDAEQRLERARGAVERLWDERDELVKRGTLLFGELRPLLEARTVNRQDGNAKGDATRKIAAAEDEIKAHDARMREARQVVQESLRVRNEVRERVSRAAQARAEPLAFPHLQRSLDERLSDLERGR